MNRRMIFMIVFIAACVFISTGLMIRSSMNASSEDMYSAGLLAMCAVAMTVRADLERRSRIESDDRQLSEGWRK